MKKLIAMVVLLIFILLLTSCNGSDLNGSDTSQGAETTQGSADTTGSYSAETNSSVLKAWTGEFSEDKLKAAINEYQSSYHNIVFAGNGEGAHIEAVDISFETDFEVSLCSVSRLAPVDDTDINVELNGYIDLALIPDCDGKRVTVDAGWWHVDDDWVQSYPVWSYLVRLTDADDTVHYYYFRVDYSALGAALTDNEINVKTESSENLKYLMTKDKDKIKIEHENYGSNVFHITTFRDNSEHQTIISLSEGIRTPDIYAGFTSDRDGYVMIFNMEGYSVSLMDDIKLACVLQTSDGGETWDKTEYSDFKVSNSREYISAACFFTDEVGFFTARYTNTDHFAPRTYWTVDGGKTWMHMPKLDVPDVLEFFGIQGDDFSTEISDVTVVDGMYTITVRICHGYSLEADGKTSSEIYIQYQSKDLINWNLV